MIALTELNLNFNKINDLEPLRNLNLLEKLYLSHNQVTSIAPLQDCKLLTHLSVFHNEIYHEDSFIETCQRLSDLKDISYEGNPISKEYGIKYRLVMLTGVKVIDEEKVTDLDRELANDYYEENGLEKPQKVVEKENIGSNKEIVLEARSMGKKNSESSLAGESKRVRFNDIDSDGQTWQDIEIEKLNAKVKELMEEKRLYSDDGRKAVFQENKYLKAQLMNMEVLVNENEELREELKGYQNISVDKRMAKVNEENKYL